MTHVLQGEVERVNTVAFSPNSRLLAYAGRGGSIRLALSDRADHFATLFHAGPVHKLAFSPDGSLLFSAGADGKVLAHYLDDLRPGFSYSGHSSAVKALDLSPDGLWGASGGEDETGEVHIWEVQSRLTPHFLAGHGKHPERLERPGVQAVAFSPDSTYLATAAQDKSVRIFDLLQGGMEVFVNIDPEAWATGLAWSPDSKYLAASVWSHAQNQVLRIWNVETGEHVRMLLVPGMGQAVVWTKSGYLAVATFEGDLYFLTPDQARVGHLRYPRGTTITAMTISPDGSYLATGHFDGLVRTRLLAAPETISEGELVLGKAVA